MSENVYCHPEHYGLTVVGCLDDPGADYSFDMLAVWQHSDGRVFYGRDAGCSCPSPFEGVDSLKDDLTEIVDADDLAVFEQKVDDHCPHADDPTGSFSVDKHDLKRKVATLMRDLTYVDDLKEFLDYRTKLKEKFDSV